MPHPIEDTFQSPIEDLIADYVADGKLNDSKSEEKLRADMKSFGFEEFVTKHHHRGELTALAWEAFKKLSNRQRRDVLKFVAADLNKKKVKK